MADEKVSVAANVLGTIGTVFWCIQLIPQVVHNYRRKDTTGLPPVMMFLWAASAVPFAVYFIVQESNIPVQVQPHVFMFFSLICWLQALYYPPRSYNRVKLGIIAAVTIAAFAGIEAGCIVPFRGLYARGITWPVTLVGIIAAILLGVGLLPPYFELYKRKGRVVGINFYFLLIDSGGALFSLFSLVAQKGHLDLLGCILYIVVLALEVGIFASQGIWLLRTRKLRKIAKEQGKDVDDPDFDPNGEKSDGVLHRQDEVTEEMEDEVTEEIEDEVTENIDDKVTEGMEVKGKE
ncbi:hypothetical protein TRVA0_012S02454 [Trichomonascus vanleenenianus]|uniref:Ilt1p n=1 Tax=Trichomonascus vanleenenianus TaxID=2268995 RepID=UPI003ECA4A48